MSGSLREEWEECCAERDRALADLARECVRVATLERANEMIEEDRKREKARAEKAEAEREVNAQLHASAELDLVEDQEALAAARRECEGLRTRVDGLRRLYTNDYLSWSKAGGPNECPHGHAAGIHCRTCDHIAETKAHEEDEARAALATPAAGEEKA